jgi:hypothetical protein
MLGISVLKPRRCEISCDLDLARVVLQRREAKMDPPFDIHKTCLEIPQIKGGEAASRMWCGRHAEHSDSWETEKPTQLLLRRRAVGSDLNGESYCRDPSKPSPRSLARRCGLPAHSQVAVD